MRLLIIGGCNVGCVRDSGVIVVVGAVEGFGCVGVGCGRDGFVSNGGVVAVEGFCLGKC